MRSFVSELRGYMFQGLQGNTDIDERVRTVRNITRLIKKNLFAIRKLNVT